MRSPEEGSGSGAGKSPNPKPKPKAKAKASAAPLAAAATSTSPPASPMMMPYPDWGATGAAASTPFFPHVAWSGQPMFSPMYYANPSMSLSTGQGTPNLNQESSEGPSSDGKDQGLPNKSKKATTGDGGKATSGFAEEDATQSGETGSDGSSATEDDSTDPQDSSADKKRASSDAFAEREAAQGRVQYSSATSESSHSGRVPKLPVSAPGRATLPGPATNLNIGMDCWNASHAGAGPVKLGPNAVNIAPLMPGREAVMPERPWMQVAERELKREKRKQSNRESARRSRLRKQQECEELARKVAELTSENTILKVEVEQLTKRSEELRAENASLMAIHPDLLTEEEQASLHGHVAVSASEGDSDSDPSTMLTVGEGSRYVHQSPVGPSTRNV